MVSLAIVATGALAVTTSGAPAAGNHISHGAPTVAGATSRSAATYEYVALGDGVAAGVGTFAKSSESCYRSSWAYPSLVADQYGWRLHDRTCDGAGTTEVRKTQASALSARTGAVTVTVGAHDVGFASVLTVCALPSWIGNCATATRAAATTTRTVLPGRLTTLYGGILSKAPNATVVATGYPRLFGTTDCHVATFFSPQDVARINALTDQVNDVIGQRARRAGFAVVDIRDQFTGHAACDEQPWINGPSSPGQESFRPNRAGHQAYAALVGPTLRPRASQRIVMPMPARPMLTPAPPRPSSPWLKSLADQLLDAKNVARAQRAGIPRTTILRLGEALRSTSPSVVLSALRELQALDRRVNARPR